MSSKKRFCVRLGIGLLLLGIVLFCPYRSTTAPEWRVQIVDQAGRPISGIQVKEGWQYLEQDFAPWADHTVADTDGRVRFPRRVTWLSLAARANSVLGAPRGEKGGPLFFIQACDADHLEEAKFFWDGNGFWNPAVHEGETRLIATAVEECGQID